MPKANYFIHQPYSGQNFVVFPFEWFVMLDLQIANTPS